MDAESVEAEIASLKLNQELTYARLRHVEKCLDTLQSPWWKRVLFRLDGWPGIRNLNAESRAWRPWHRGR